MEWAETWTIIGGCVAVVVAIGTLLRNFKIDIGAKIDRIETRMDRLETRIDRIETKVEGIQASLNEIDKRLYAVEMVLHMKDCCMLKQDQNLKKAE